MKRVSSHDRLRVDVELVGQVGLDQREHLLAGGSVIVAGACASRDRSVSGARATASLSARVDALILSGAG